MATGSEGDRAAALTAAVADLLNTYGPNAVIEEVKAQTRKRSGAPTKPDWSILHPQLQADARKLLSGELNSRPTNAEIAREFEKTHPDPHVMPRSVKRRIKDKLKERRDLYVLYNAFLISETESPWWLHLRTTELLSEVDKKLGPVWLRALEQQQTLVAHALVLRGELDDSESFASILASIRDGQEAGGMCPQGLLPRRDN